MEYLNIRNLKMMVIASFSVLVVLAFTFADTAVNTSHASEGGAPTGRTGAPGESNCTSCHNQNSGPGSISIVAPANYTPGQTYQIQVQNVTTDTTRRNWGFELIPLAGSNMAGTLAIGNANTRIRVSGTKSYITQTLAGTFPNTTGGSTWTFNWTAPATDVGTVTFYAAGIHGDNDGGEGGDQTYLTSKVMTPGQAVVIHHGFTDFDADGKADPSIYRGSNGFWYINRSTAGFTATQWGLATDKLAPADYDGDDKADVAVWREDVATVAGFYILQSSTNTMRIERFGQTGDDPTIVGDWDGDGKADPAIFRSGAGQSVIYFRGSLNNPSGNVNFIPWGANGDKAVRGDFDGDSKMDAAVFRPSNGVWYISQSSNGAVRYENWGIAADKLVPADYDGDSKTDLAVFRSGVWYIKQSSNSQTSYVNWGLSTDTLVPADYDGDGKTDAAIYRNGVWYERLSGTGSLSVINFGTSTDTAVAGAFVK